MGFFRNRPKGRIKHGKQVSVRHISYINFNQASAWHTWNRFEGFEEHCAVAGSDAGATSLYILGELQNQ